MRNLLLLSRNVQNAGLKMLGVLFFVLAMGGTTIAQTCTISDTECPQVDPVCADEYLNGVFGAYVNWTPPEFELDCGTGVPGESSFYMEYDLPESQSSCWAFNGVQRVGSNNLRLWQSSGTGDPWYRTPLVYINTTGGMPVGMDLLNPNNRIISWYIQLLDAGNNVVYTSNTLPTPFLWCI